MITVSVTFDVNEYLKRGGTREHLYDILNALGGDSEMSAAMDRLVASVGTLTNLAESLQAMNTGLAAQVRDAAGDRDASMALADEIDAEVGRLSGATVAGTPAEGLPTAPPPVKEEAPPV